MYLGIWEIDDLLTFRVNTHNASTGAVADASSVPSYRVYEDETTTPILTGTMSLQDSANTDGYYSEQITLSAANGFEVGKCYGIRVQATVAGVTGATEHTFQIGTSPVVPPAVGSPTPATDPAQTTAYLTTRNGAGTAKGSVTINFALMEGPGDAGHSYDRKPFAATSNSSGSLEVTLLREATYKAIRGDGNTYQFTTADASTYQMPEVIGYDA